MPKRFPRGIRRAGDRRRDRRARRPPTGSRRAVTGPRRSTRSASRARRPAATGSRRARSASSTTWASPTGCGSSNASTACARSRTASPSSWPGPNIPTSRLRLRGAPPRARRDGRRAGRQGRRDALAATEAIAPLIVDGALLVPARWSATRTPATTRDPGPLRRWSPTAPTPGSAGRSGTARDRTYPLGMAIRGYFTSPLHDDPWIESHLDIRDRDGNHLPGYGWIFPVGDGTVNVGVGLLSTFTGWKNVNTTPPDGRLLRDGARARGASRPRPRPAPPPAAASPPADR